MVFQIKQAYVLSSGGPFNVISAMKKMLKFNVRICPDGLFCVHILNDQFKSFKFLGVSSDCFLNEA